MIFNLECVCVCVSVQQTQHSASVTGIYVCGCSESLLLLLFFLFRSPRLAMHPIAGLEECSSRMCWTPAGLWHFLSVYLTAYPPQDYRGKKRREHWQKHPFPLAHPLFFFLLFFNSHTHARAQTQIPTVVEEGWGGGCNSLANA